MRSELPAGARGSVEPVVRRGPEGRFLFLVNRTDENVPVPGLDGEILLGATDTDGTLTLAPRAVAVLRQPAS